MVESPIPQDILKYKAKFVANFSAREAVCLGIGAALILLGFFNLFSWVPNISYRICASAVLGLPCFMLGFFKPLGQPLEKYLTILIWDNLICPPTRRKEVHHPEFEKYDKKPSWYFEASSKTKQKYDQGKFRVKKSKEYPGIK